MKDARIIEKADRATIKSVIIDRKALRNGEWVLCGGGREMPSATSSSVAREIERELSRSILLILNRLLRPTTTIRASGYDPPNNYLHQNLNGTAQSRGGRAHHGEEISGGHHEALCRGRGLPVHAA